jgi:hypothetical protein
VGGLRFRFFRLHACWRVHLPLYPGLFTIYVAPADVQVDSLVEVILHDQSKYSWSVECNNKVMESFGPPSVTIDNCSLHQSNAYDCAPAAEQN